MLFSNPCNYALRAMIFLGEEYKKGELTGLQSVAEAIGAPRPFMAKILQKLAREGLLQSTKGPHGGFRLAHPPQETSLAQVVMAMDGKELFEGCGLGLPQCSEANPCPLHYQFLAIRNALSKMLSDAKVEDLAQATSEHQYVLKR